MSATRELADYVADFSPDTLPDRVLMKAKLVTIDAIGSAIGGLPFELTSRFSALAQNVGGGTKEATIIGSSTRVSMPLACFANCALSTMLDYTDFEATESQRSGIWIGPMAVPGALAAGEVSELSGREFLASVAAGYECAARIIHSMDLSVERSHEVNGDTLSVFAAAAAVANGLRASHDEMLSTLGMTGIYIPVPGLYKWVGDQGLTPRRDVKQGWAWMALTGAFAAVSAKSGLQALQSNNVLDGDRGLWRMVGMDQFDEAKITEDLGTKFYIDNFNSKAHPGCGFTHSAIEGVLSILRSEEIDPSQILQIEVGTSRYVYDGMAVEDPFFEGLPDKQFNLPYQVAAAAVMGQPGPNWYRPDEEASTALFSIRDRVHVTVDEECDRIFRETGNWATSKVRVSTADERVYDMSVPPRSLGEKEDLCEKFLTTGTQVVGREKAEEILAALDGLEHCERVSELLPQLAVSG